MFFNGNLPQYAIKCSRDDQKLTCAQNYEHPFMTMRVRIRLPMSVQSSEKRVPVAYDC